MMRFLAAAVLGALSFHAVANDAEDAKVRAAIQSLVPGATIDTIAEAAMPGFYEVVLQGQLVYVSADGRYLLQGSVFDIATKTDLTEASRAVQRRNALKTLGSDKRIAYAPESPKHTVTVFTDIDCGYCRRMHQQMAEYNELGIAVEYLFFPRAGLGSESFDKAVSVWCAADRGIALTEAKAGKELDKKECRNPIEEEYALGNKIGVNGTPAVITADGTQVGGYLPPEQLLQRLEQLAAKAPK
jgi:thiol:disulfide interchange protein DsbC